MSLILLPAAGHRRMPWKNGRGVTTEVAVHPHGSGLSDFGWRISMARVEEDGDFSLFPGIDRTLVVIDGDGIALSIADAPPQLLTPQGDPLSFPADVPAQASLPGGPITDLNVMTRRGQFHHRVVRVLAADGDADADWQVVIATQPARLDIGGQPVRVGVLDAVLCDGSDACQPVTASASVCIIRIGRVQVPAET